MKKFAVSLSLALASSLFAAPMLASSGEAKQVTVQFADLNLANDAGVDALYSRIRGAARTACAGAEGRSAVQHREWNACMSVALDGAVAAVGSNALSSKHLALGGSLSSSVAKTE